MKEQGRDPHAELTTAIIETFGPPTAATGTRRIHTVLTRQGWQVAKKRCSR
ncbi:hypothetical protein [Actinosynnema sp. ALI-1.44]|uniref:hypothetical protein n=1 Tax=Actinosynnema sp. ALI-1.44 TaxID=1933779 RepID=UPI00143CD1E0|nr:hypothetical protein [Actinosynnema sp. ALI-1.44]